MPMPGRALTLALVLLTAVPAPGVAQDAPSREELLRELAERDSLIAALRGEIDELQAQLAAPGRGPVPSPAPAPGPSRDDSLRLVVDDLAAERALERTLVQSGALLLPRGAVELAPTLATGVGKVDFPVQVDVGTGVVAGVSALERTESVLDLTARIGLPRDSQLEIGFPYRSVTEESVLTVAGSPRVESKRSGRGSGDVTIGFAKTLLREGGGARPDIVGRLAWTSGEGELADDGVFLGGGFEAWTGSLSFVKRLDPLALFLTLGLTDVRSADTVAPGDQVSVSFGTALAVTPGSSLFGSIAHRSISAARSVDGEWVGSDLDVTTLSLGLSTRLRRGTLLSLYSEIGLSRDAPDYSLAFALPVRLR
jgi:hypothetical protein